MKNIQNIIIETERLLLVPTTKEYIQEIFKEFTDEVTRYMFPKTPKEISETEERINSCLVKREKWEELQMTILDKITKEFFGNVGLHRVNESIPELWIWIKQSAYGKKIWKEAVAWLESWGQENLDFEYIVYPVDKDNIPSRKIAESLWWIVQIDENGNELIKTKGTLDPNKKLNSVEYRIYKKLSLPEWLQMIKKISDAEYKQMIHIMENNDLSRYNVTKDDFYAIKNEKNEIVAFGRIFEIGPKQWEVWSLRVNETQRGKKLWLVVFQELIIDKKWDNEIFLATKSELGSYYKKLWFEIITKNIPEKLVHTGIWAKEHGIDFIIMKLG